MTTYGQPVQRKECFVGQVGNRPPLPCSGSAGDAQLAALVQDRVRQRLVQLRRQFDRLPPGAIGCAVARHVHARRFRARVRVFCSDHLDAVQGEGDTGHDDLGRRQRQQLAFADDRRYRQDADVNRCGLAHRQG